MFNFPPLPNSYDDMAEDFLMGFMENRQFSAEDDFFNQFSKNERSNTRDTLRSFDLIESEDTHSEPFNFSEPVLNTLHLEQENYNPKPVELSLNLSNKKLIETEIKGGLIQKDKNGPALKFLVKSKKNIEGDLIVKPKFRKKLIVKRFTSRFTKDFRILNKIKRTKLYWSKES